MTINLSIEVEAGFDQDDNLKLALAKYVHDMYGVRGWLGLEEAVTSIAVDHEKYDPESDKFIDDIFMGLTAKERGLCRGGMKIQAIKAIRERSYLGLGEAKMLVDNYSDYIRSGVRR